MNPFWNNIYDDVKDRRYGMLFFAALLVSLGLVALVFVLRVYLGASEWAHLSANEFCFSFLCLGPVLVLLMAVLAWRWIRAARRKREEQLKYAILSRDELAKARSKLKSRMKIEPPKSPTKTARRLTAQRPDTNLKY